MVIVFFDYVTQGNVPIDFILGVVAAHTYWFLEEIYPRMPGNNGRKLISTPALLTAWIPAEEDATGNVGGGGAAGSGGSGSSSTPWGRGQRLGT